MSSKKDELTKARSAQTTTQAPSKEDRPSVLVAAEFRSHIGPIPSPETLAGYERLVPGTANRILLAFESEGAHRRAMDVAYLKESSRYRGRGQWFAGGIAATMLGVAAYATSVSQPWVAGTAIGAIATVVGIFVLRKHDKSEDETDADEP